MNRDTILLDFTDDKGGEPIHWTLRDAFRGVQIFGGIGSGKTSGSGQTLARAFLRKGFGGLVLCAKPDERIFWERMAREEGRYDDLKIFTDPKPDEHGNIKDKEFFFNPLEYERKRKGGGETFNLVNLFMQIYQMGRIVSGEGLSSGGERFWDNALKRCMARMIDFLKLADELVTIDNMYRLISECLTKNEVEYLKDLRKKREDGEDTIKAWAEVNFYVHCVVNSQEEYLKIPKSDQAAIAKHKKRTTIIRNYFEREFANLAERTKTIVVESFLGLAQPFQDGILEKYFNSKITISPEETFQDRRIIILDFPIKNHLEAGVYAQGLFKLLWQQAVERRVYKSGDIPVFLWVDESQNFLSAYDQIFQTTARSAGVSTVFISQNISNYYVAIGGKNPTARVNSLLGNLSTKIFHNNTDFVTNEWAAKIIGRSWQDVQGFNVGGQNPSMSISKQYHWNFEPSRFALLKTGGFNPSTGEKLPVQAVIVASQELKEGENFLCRSFTQT